MEPLRDSRGRFGGAVDIDASALLGIGSRDTAALSRLPQGINRAATEYGLDLRNYAEGRFERGYSSTASRSRNYLQNRSGAGRRSFGIEVSGGDGAVDMEFFTTQFYVGVQEFGAEISPRTADYLTIPMDDNLNPSGEAYETATEAIDLGGFFYESASGDLFIAREEDGFFETLFYLTEGPVEVPQRLGVGRYIERKDVQERLLGDLTHEILGVTAEFIG